jgi:hypothetical protein
VGPGDPLKLGWNDGAKCHRVRVASLGHESKRG